MKKITNNVELVNDLMNRSPYGALSEVFVLYAVREYAEKVAAAPAVADNGLFNGDLWKRVATDVRDRCDAFYNRHDQGAQGA